MRLRMLMFFCFTLGLSAAAAAQDSTHDRERALALFKESATHYEAERYSVAAALLEEAYALYPEPKLLYNLGRAREADGDPKGALTAYRAYLDAAPESAQHPEVRRRIERLRSQTSEPAYESEPEPRDDPDAAESSSERAVTSPPPQTPGPPNGAQGRSLRRTGGWGLVGGGGAVLGAALTVGLLARSEHREAAGEPVHANALELQNSADRKAVVASALAGVGGALAIAGGAWLLFGSDADAAVEGSGRPARSWALGLKPLGVDCTVRF